MNINLSPKTLPRNLGILGMTLPFILWIGSQNLAPSISHYYYTNFGIYFTGVLFAFGLFLYAYKGYDSDGKKMSDNWITNIAGIFAILTALIPTTHIPGFDFIKFGGPNAHANPVLGAIHLGAAASFLFIMGYLSIFRFTLSGKTKSIYYARRYWLYKICGVMVWLSIGFLAVEFALEIFFEIAPISAYSVFFAEVVALVFFGAAWLVKSQIKSLKYFGIVSEEELTASQQKK